jgi:hypothetical protein
MKCRHEDEEEEGEIFDGKFKGRLSVIQVKPV